MAKDIKFNIKLTVDGKEQVVTASTNIKGLAQQLGIARTRSEKFTVSMLKWNQSTQAIQNAYSSFQQLTSVMKEMTSAYEVQEVAETKLSSVMKQRMNASSSDIESIKKLASEQQKLGVVGDEVSLSGIQQVATFVNQKSTLETLMPALNNLIAHEGGLNATTEQATTLGNLLGKAMQGQTGVLRRVGVTFTDAQARVMKFGSESEKAAMLAQIVADNYGNVNEALAKTDSGKVKQMTNEFGDMKEAIGKALAAYMPMIEKMSEIGFAVSGVAVMVTSLGSLAKMLGVAKLATIAYTATVKFTKTAMVSLTVATGSATVAATALAAAYTMGLSLAITGVATLISNLCSSEDDAAKTTGEMSDAAQKAKDRQDELNTTMTNASSEISIMTAKLKEFKGTKDQEKKIVQECNEKYGEAMGYYGSVSDWYRVLVSNSQTYCEQMVNEARIRQLANQAAKAEQDAHDLIYNKDGSKKKGTDKRQTEKVRTTVNMSGSAGVTSVDTYRDVAIKGSSADEKSIAKQKEANAAKQQMNGILKENISLQNQLNKPVKGTTRYNSDPTAGGGNKGGGNKGGGNDDEVKAAAGSYTALGDAISKAQKDLDATAPTDTAKIQRLTTQIQTSKAAQQQVKSLQAEYAKPASLTTLEDYDNEISRQQGLLKTAGEAERVTITATIAELKKKKAAMERASEPAPVMSEIKSYDELNAAINYYNDRLNTADAAGRTAIESQLTMLNKLKEDWDAAAAAANKPAGIENLSTLKALDNAVQYYQQQMQTASASELTGLQETVDALTRKRELLASISGISTGGAELGELKGLTGKELKIRLKAIGIDEIENKIRQLRKLSQSSMTDPKQKKEIQTQIAEWKKYGTQLKKNSVTLKAAYGSVRNVGNGISSLTKTLKGGGNAWDKMTGAVEAGIEIYEGINAIIGIVKALTAAKTAEQAGEAAVQAGVNSAESTTWMGLAAAKTAAAYADMPFVGAGLAAAQMAAFKTMQAAALIPAFADGGLAYGTTLAMVGEYAGASNNPEIIAPLDKLRNMIEPQSYGGGNFRFEIEGRKLVGVLANETRISSKSGKRTNIKI